MKAARIYFVAPLAAVVALWYVAHFFLGLVGELIVDGGYADLLFPFRSPHALEEAAEGLLNPLRDPRFVIYSLLLGAVVFGCSSYWAGRRARGGMLWLTTAALILGLAFVVYQLRYIFDSGYPSVMLTAGIAMFCYFAAALIFGLTTAVLRRRVAGPPHG